MQLKDVPLAVHDLDRSVRFYERAIGLTVLESGLDSGGSRARLGAGGASLLDLVERPDAAAPGDTAGRFHVAWLLADQTHLGAAFARLDADGVWLTGLADHHVSEAVYLDDPDGHGIELYADRPVAGWRAGGVLVMHNSGLDIEGLRNAATAAGIAPKASGQGLRLGHLHLEAIDLDRASRFAEEALGLELQLGWPNPASPPGTATIIISPTTIGTGARAGWTMPPSGLGWSRSASWAIAPKGSPIRVASSSPLPPRKRLALLSCRGQPRPGARRRGN